MRDIEAAKKKVRERYELRADAWKNPFTGLGTDRDKTIYSYFDTGTRVADEEAEILYSDNDVAARICDTAPEYAFRKGVEVKVVPEDSDNVEESVGEAKATESAIATELKNLKAVSRFTDAAVWANVFGGCALLIGGADGAKGEQLAEPLNEDAIKSITHLNVIDKRYLSPMDWYDDPSESNFGEPKTYMITPYVTGQIATSDDTSYHKIHESRLLLFSGVRTSTRRRQENEGWKDSALQKSKEAIKQFGVSFDTLAHIITDANQGVYKMDGLIDALAADEQDVIQQRLNLLDVSRSAVRALVLDAETEEFNRQNFSWAGFKEPFELLMQRLSLATSPPIPVSILMGRAPSGMNATGEMDIKSFYDGVEAYRAGEPQTNLEKLVRLLFKASEGPTSGAEPDQWEISFPSMYSTTPKEEAEIYETRSRGDKANVEVGILLADEVALSRYGPGGDNGKISIDLEARLGNENEGEELPEADPATEEGEEPDDLE
jgi:phage-related protein (TIGR01555 family)